MGGERKKPPSMELRYSSAWQWVNKRQSLHNNLVEVETLMHVYVLSSKNTAAKTETQSEWGKVSIRKHNKIIYRVVN